MLAQELRPQKFKDVVGNTLNKEILKAIAHDPERSPSTIIMEGDFGCGKCVTGETRVLTNEGYVRIDSLYPSGEKGYVEYSGPLKVQTSRGWVTPTDLYREESADVLEVTLSTGHTIRGTPNHRVATISSEFDVFFKRLGDLSVGQVVGLYSPVKFASRPMIVPERSLLKDMDSMLEEPYQCRQSSFIRLYREHRSNLLARLIQGPVEFLKKFQVLCDSLMLHSYFVELKGTRFLYLSENSFLSIIPLYQYTFGESIYEGVAETPPLNVDLKVPLTHEQERLLFSEMRSYVPTRDLLNPMPYTTLLKSTGPISTKARAMVNWAMGVVVSIKKTREDVYDLCVPGTHDFYANGFMNHNTTSARLLAKALNCDSFKDDLCGKCETCKSDINSVPFYTEYDVTSMGNIDSIKALRDTFYYTIPGHTRVITLDEVHAASRAAMNALLKVFEEAPAGVKFVLCTTEVDKILPTIRSRSLELKFTVQSEEDIVKNLEESASRVGISLSRDVAELIAVRSKGHMRNAHMLLDQYSLIGEEAFVSSVRSSTDDVLRLLVHLRTRKKEAYFQAVDSLLTYPLSDLIDDFQKTLLSVLKVQMGVLDNPKMAKVATLYGRDLVKIIRVCSADWMLEAFRNDITLQTALLALYQMFQPVESAGGVSRNAKV